MKSIRIQAVIAMARAITIKGSFTADEITKEVGCSKSSFNRGVSDFRCYLAEHEPDQDLVFETNTQTYRVEKASIF